jgi:hypothetical protein
VHQYREGKVKSTPTRGVKQFLKPDAYKQSEFSGQSSVISIRTDGGDAIGWPARREPDRGVSDD